jgi:iron complex transport system substrate-binding protein
MAIFALESAGGMNVARDARPVRKTNIAFYGKERILSHAGEIDVYLAQYGAMNTPSIALIKNEPGFQAIKAVKNNEIYILDERVVSRPTMRLLVGIFEIGKILYPDVFNEKGLEILKTQMGLK